MTQPASSTPAQSAENANLLENASCLLPTQPPSQATVGAGRKRALQLMAGFFLCLGLLWLAWWAIFLRTTESTDDAYTAGNAVSVMPQVAGRIMAVLADNTDHVQAGQALVPIDPVDARLAYEHALVTLASAVRDTCRLMAELRQSEAVVAVRQVELERYKGNTERRRKLVRDRAVREEEFLNSQDDVNAARHTLIQAQAQRDALSAVLLDTGVAEQPAVRLAASTVRERWLDLERTVVRSPVNGQVAQRSVQVGQYVAPGVVLMAVVDLDNVWVDANFKEGQIKRMRIGQPARISADMYGGSVTYEGTVQGFSAGTGSVFSLLPPQNATGNWIKVVQRVPVRIALKPGQLREHPLLLGLSVVVSVDTAEQSGPMLLTQARAEAPAALAAQSPPVDLTPVEARISAIIEANAREFSPAPGERATR